MSVERGENEYGQTSDEIKNDLIEFLRGSPVNSPKYQAFKDYKSECELNETLGDLIERINKKSLDIEWYTDDSQLRITEHRIAFIEDKIEQKKMTIPDYEEAYVMIWSNFDELGKVLCEEGRQKYPKSDKDLDRYIDDKWREVMDDISLELLDNS